MVCIYYYVFWRIHKSEGLVTVNKGKPAYRYMYQISECEYLLLQ